MVIAIVLGRQRGDYRVLVGDLDLTSVVSRIELVAAVGETSEVILTLSAPVEITGEPTHLEIHPPEESA